ncbi:MAG TPA: flagellar hook-associated protein 3 [Ramlibacter sp.]
MRISTQTFYDQGQSAMGSQQLALFRIQQKVATGRNILSPSDDPVGAARALNVSQALSEGSQYAASRSQATTMLSREDDTLESVALVLQNVKSLVVQAGNGTLSDADRASLATTIQGQLDQLVALANTGSGVFGAVSVSNATDPNFGKDFSISFTGGNYSVQTKDTPPVVVSAGPYEAGTPISFGGMQVSIKGTPADGDSFDVSTARNAGTDVFAAMGELVNALKKPLEGGGDKAQAELLNALSTANVKITNAHDNVLTIRSSVGSRMAELEQLDSDGESRALIDKSYLSEIEDLDYYDALSEFTQRQTSLQAAQQTFVSLSGLALFKYL